MISEGLNIFTVQLNVYNVSYGTSENLYFITLLHILFHLTHSKWCKYLAVKYKKMQIQRLLKFMYIWVAIHKHMYNMWKYLTADFSLIQESMQ